MNAPAISAETVDEESIQRTDEIKLFSPDCLVDHPANPPERVKAPAVKDLMELIQDFGQRDPVRARVMDADRLQILSGHRRVAACRLLDRDVRVEVVVCSDAQALREVMLGNAERKDLDAVERAELLQAMIDEGIDRDEAGAMFGLMSESGIKNALRISKLPPSIKKLLRDGTIPARVARYLVPFADHPKALDELAGEVKSSIMGAETLGFLMSDPKVVVDSLVKTDGSTKGFGNPNARPIDGETKYHIDYNYEEATCGFEITPEIRRKLKVVEVPVRGQTMAVATNVKLFDKLNQPHLVKRSAYGSPKKKKSKKPAAKKLTAKQQAVEDARRRKEADEKLKNRVPAWSVRFLRCLLSYQVDDFDSVIDSTLPWIMVQLSSDREWLTRATETQVGKIPRTWQGASDRLLGKMAGEDDISTRIWRVLIWPQQRDDWQPAEGVTEETPKEIPLNPRVSRHFDGTWPTILRNCEDGMMSLEGAWKYSSQGPTNERKRDTGAKALAALVREYLELHTAEQLERIAKAAKYKFTVTAKGKRIDALMARHHKQPLPVPKAFGALLRKGPKR